jgi:putative nucleotidyltransferase with HDIG domain
MPVNRATGRSGTGKVRAAEARGAQPPPDPLPLLKGLMSLRKLTGMYSAGHPMIGQKVRELEEVVHQHLRNGPAFRIDIIHGDVYLDGVFASQDSQGNVQIVGELTDLGIDSIQIHEGVEAREIQAVAEFLWQFKQSPDGEAVEAQLERRQVRHITLGRLVPLDTRRDSQQWPDAPTGRLDPAYEESLLQAQRAFDQLASSGTLSAVTVRDLVHLLISKVARSNAALGQILAVKQYEPLTYCHSVNVALLSLLLARQIGLDQPTTAALVEAALLHDIGKVRVPVELVTKAGALGKWERSLMEAHTTFGAGILVDIEGLRSLTPVVALEHHRAVKGSGYPDLGEGVVPHVMSQIVSVADVYEALTGVRSYQAPTLPEQACLVLARLAGEKLNTALVKAFVNAVTFFPLGSLVRTSRGEIGVVVGTKAADPLHPLLALVTESLDGPRGQIDTSTRDSSGAYERHIVETLMPQEGTLDATRFLASAPAEA